MKLKRKTILLLVVLSLLCVSLIVGVSYSIYQLDQKQTTPNVIQVGCFTIEFEDYGTDSSTYTNLSLTNSYPISTNTALNETPYKFKITNTCDYIAKTNIAINVLKTSSISAIATNQNKTIGDMINVAIKEGSNSVSAPVLLSSLNEGTIRSSDNETAVSYIIRTEYLEKDESKTYNIWMWVPETINNIEVGNEAQGLTLYSKIDVYSLAVDDAEVIEGDRVAYIPDGTASILSNFKITGGTENSTNVGEDGTFDLVVSGKNLLNINVERSNPSDIESINTTNRIFIPNSYVVGLAYNNYFTTNNVNAGAGVFSYELNLDSIYLDAGSGYGIGFPFNASEGEKYTISYNSNSSPDVSRVGILFYKKDGTFITSNSIIGDGNRWGTYIMPNEIYFLVVTFCNNSGKSLTTFMNIQLEEGEEATDFEPYKEKRYTIELKDTSNNIINGLSSNDTLKKVNGVWVIDNDTTQTELASSTQGVLNNIEIYDGVSRVWVDDDILITHITVDFYEN